MVEAIDLKQLGVGALFVVVVLDRVFGFLKAKRESEENAASGEMQREMEQAIYKLTLNMELQTRILERIEQRLAR
jgi:hypothetical protein